jgi:hydroxymethylbilane synthase
VLEWIGHLDDPETHVCILAERAFLVCIEGGCQVPVAAHAVLKNGRVRIEGLVASVNGETAIQDHCEGPSDQAEVLGKTLATRLLDRGAKEILRELYEKGGGRQAG